MSPTNKLYSIIIPVYNRANLIQETLDSVKQQLYRPIEVVIVNDGSTDDSSEVIQEWKVKNAEPDRLIINYIYQDNSGVASARNRGYDSSTGDFIYFLDSDDRIYPHALETVNKVFENDEADLILTGYDIFNHEDNSITSTVYGYSDRKQIEHLIKGEIWAITLRVFYDRSLVEKVGKWNEIMTMSEDTDFIERALCKAKNPIGIKNVVASLRRGSRDHRSFDYDQEWAIYCKENFVKQILDKEDISMSLKRLLVHQMVRLYFRLRLKNQINLANRYKSIATVASKEINPTLSLRIELLLSQWGWLGSTIRILYKKFRRLFNRFEKTA